MELFEHVHRTKAKGIDKQYVARLYKEARAILELIRIAINEENEDIRRRFRLNYLVQEGNIGTALLVTRHNEENFQAHSSIDDEEEAEGLPLDLVYLQDIVPPFQTITIAKGNQIAPPPLGYDRKTDAESKILTEIARRYQMTPEVAGTLHLYTKYFPCDSCKGVIQQFQERMPNIRIVVYHGE